MVKVPTKKTRQIEDFVNKAEGNQEPEKRGRGNPRKKQTKSCSFSLPFTMSDWIDEQIKEAAENGVIGLSRSDIAMIALNQLAETKPEAFKDLVVKHIKNK